MTKVANSSSLAATLRENKRATLLLLTGCVIVWGLATLKPAPSANPIPAIIPTSVDVIYAQPSRHILIVKTQGTVAPKREIDLVAEVGGRITQVSDDFVNGSFIKAGKTLVQIDQRDYELGLIQAQSRIADAEQLLATEKGRGRQAKREWRELGNEEANQLFLRQPQLASAQAKVHASLADRDKTQINLERTTVKAPFNGRIRNTHVDLGQYLSPGSKIATIYDTSSAEIRLPLTDSQAALINLPLGTERRGEAPQVTLSAKVAGLDHQWQGRITRTEASINTRSRLYYAVVEVEAPFDMPEDNGRAPMLVGLFVEAEIQGKRLDQVVKLPQSTLLNRNQLLIVDRENLLQHKEVTLLHSDEYFVWVRGDLSSEDAIVVKDPSSMTAGSLVTINPVETLPAITALGQE